MKQEDKSLGALEAFDRYIERRKREQKLRNYRWTLDEVEDLQAESPPTLWLALKPFIDESNRRGDFKYPYQMNRKEAQAYLNSKGIEGEVWSQAEAKAIIQDTKLNEEYGPELNRARDEGRVVFGKKGANAGGVHHFVGEDGRGAYDLFKRRFNAKLKRIDQYNEAQDMIAATRRKLKALAVEDTNVRLMHSYLVGQIRKIFKLSTNYYPVSSLDGYVGLKHAAEALEVRIRYSESDTEESEDKLLI
jgi:hypothetical protein